MKRLVCTVLLLAPITAAADRSYNSETDITHDCTKEPSVSVNASKSTYVFTGTCDKVSINGSDNTITLENVKKLAVSGATNTVAVTAADKIAINGSKNTLTYKKGLTTKKPKIATLGTGNKVTKAK